MHPEFARTLGQKESRPKGRRIETGAVVLSYFDFFFIPVCCVRSLTTGAVPSMDITGASAALRFNFFPVRLSDMATSVVLFSACSPRGLAR